MQGETTEIGSNLLASFFWEDWNCHTAPRSQGRTETAAPMSAFQRHQHVHTPGSLLGFHRVAPMCSPPGTPQCTSVFSIDNTFSAASSLEREDGLRCVSLSLSDNTCTKPEQCVVPHEKTQRTVRGELLSSTASSPSTAQSADDVRTNPNEAKPAAGNAWPVPLLAGRPRVSGRRPFSPGPRFESAPKKAGQREATGTQGWWQVNMEAARGPGLLQVDFKSHLFR